MSVTIKVKLSVAGEDKITLAISLAALKIKRGRTYTIDNLIFAE